MSAPFVTQLRSRRKPIEIGAGAGSLTIRVEVSEFWDAIKVVARPETQTAEVKTRVIEQFYPSETIPDELVLKFRGWEILDERASLAECGLTDGSILLLAHRRRRPVR